MKFIIVSGAVVVVGAVGGEAGDGKSIFETFLEIFSGKKSSKKL